MRRVRRQRLVFARVVESIEVAQRHLGQVRRFGAVIEDAAVGVDAARVDLAREAGVSQQALLLLEYRRDLAPYLFVQPRPRQEEELRRPNLGQRRRMGLVDDYHRRSGRCGTRSAGLAERSRSAAGGRLARQHLAHPAKWMGSAVHHVAGVATFQTDWPVAELR